MNVRYIYNMCVCRERERGNLKKKWRLVCRERKREVIFFVKVVFICSLLGQELFFFF